MVPVPVGAEAPKITLSLQDGVGQGRAAGSRFVGEARVGQGRAAGVRGMPD